MDPCCFLSYFMKSCPDMSLDQSKPCRASSMCAFILKNMNWMTLIWHFVPLPVPALILEEKSCSFFPFSFSFFFEDVVAGVIQCWNFILLLYFCRGGLCAETLSRVNWRQEKKLLWGNLKWRFVINEFSLFILSLNVECNHCLIKYCHILVHNFFAVFSSLSFVTSVFICYQQN